MINRKPIADFLKFIITNDFLYFHDNNDCCIVSEFITTLQQHFYNSLSSIIVDAGYKEISTPFFVNEDLYFRYKNDDEKYSCLKFPALLYQGGQRLKNAYLVTPSIDVYTEMLFERRVHSYKNLPMKVFSKTLSLCVREGESLLNVLAKEKFELNCFCEPTKLLEEQKSIDRLIELILDSFRIDVNKSINLNEILYYINDGHEDVVLCQYSFISDEQISQRGIKYTDKTGHSMMPKCINCQISGALFWYFLACHFDGQGMILPASYLPFDVIILPVFSNQIDKKNLVDYVHELEKFLAEYHIRFFTDYEEESIGNKHYKWEKHGIPIRVEIGYKEYTEKSITIINRYTRRRKDACREEDLINEINKVNNQWN